MMILNFLLNFLVRPQDRAPFMITGILGCFFLILAAGIGIFFLFQALVPIIGYLESGAALSALLAGVGFLLLFLSRRKYGRPIDNVMGEAEEIFKKIDSEFKKLDLTKKLKENAPTILLCSFVAGLVLSQLKDVKKIAQFKDKLLQLKDSSTWKSWLK